jgi:hypothetical protein
LIHSEGSTSNDNSDSKIPLIYEYVEKSITAIRSNLDALNTKLGLMIGFNATFIRFSPGLPDKSSLASMSCYSCLVLKVLSCAFLLVSIGICLWGLSPESVPAFLKPKRLLEEAKKGSKEDYQIAIIDFWDEEMENLYEIKEKKSERLKCAIKVFGLAACLSGVDIIITSLMS